MVIYIPRPPVAAGEAQSGEAAAEDPAGTSTPTAEAPPRGWRSHQGTRLLHPLASSPIATCNCLQGGCQPYCCAWRDEWVRVGEGGRIHDLTTLHCFAAQHSGAALCWISPAARVSDSVNRGWATGAVTQFYGAQERSRGGPAQ